MKTLFLPLLLLFALAMAGRGTAQCDTFGYRAEVYVAADGDSLPYRLLTPDSVTPGRRYPLVLFLHGAGERGHDNCEQLRHGAALFADSAARQRFPAYVLFPQCPSDEFWPAISRQDRFGHNPSPFPLSADLSRPLRLADELLEQSVARLPIDTTRIYVVGLSMGGMGTLDLVCRRPERFAAAVAICGGVNVHRLTQLRGTRTRFRLIHGAADPLVPVRFSREAATILRRAGVSVEYIELPGVGHGSWFDAFRRPDFLPWLFGAGAAAAASEVCRIHDVSPPQKTNPRHSLDSAVPGILLCVWADTRPAPTRSIARIVTSQSPCAPIHLLT